MSATPATPATGIRPATVADVPALVELEELLFGVDAWSAGQLTDEITGPGRRGWIAAATEESPGMIDRSIVPGYCLTMTVGDIADLHRIGVHPWRQRSGTARALLDAATASAKAGGADRMLLEVSAANTAALGFYAAAGFTEIDRRPRYYKDGADAIVMRLTLSTGCNWTTHTSTGEQG